MKRSIHAVAWVLLAVSAFLLWPERWGGTMTYVVTSGNSMEPTWRAGDLAVLRTAGSYSVGDVAAFRSADIKQIVMHRIVEQQGDAFRFKGDNNDFLDRDVVAEDEVLGKLLFRVPAAGRYLNWLLQPVNLAIAAAALIFLLGDRKKDQPGTPAKPPLGRLCLRALEIPSTAITAEVADEADLDRLAEHYDRPVLEVEGDARRYVLDGTVVYTWAKGAARPNERRATPQGRDWNYTGRHLRAVPQPRHEPDLSVSSR